MIQNAAAYGASNSNSNNTTAFPGLGQTRNGLSSPAEAQERSLNSGLRGGGMFRR